MSKLRLHIVPAPTEEITLIECVRFGLLFFCSFNVTFYAWLKKNIDKQTNDETFVLHSEVLLLVAMMQNIAT